ncbi:MAG: phosphoribosylformylglycinamidine synthase subunit PurL [Thermoplasmata archaeon]
MSESGTASEIPVIGMSKDQLDAVSKDMNLGLSSDEMSRIKTYFETEGRNPTDVEMQAVAQAWSEHCSYKSSKIHLKKYIFGIGKEKIVAEGDAGLVSLDYDTAVAFKIESHNHPSAIEPYGGAATGVGGILRDILSMGAQPIAVTDVLYFGTKKKEGFPSPRFIETGVISGIRDYGNRVGIPTVSGGIVYSDFFSPNVLVNVGCVGLVKKDKIRSSAISEPGIQLILAGGKTGRDGIHGVNMASAEMKKGQEDITTVQLGSPITKEPLIHAVLEANERGLIYALKDLGGGGLSSVVGEMLESGGMGGVVYLDKVPLKESSMRPWEIWISESQERMLLAVGKENVNEVLRIMEGWDITSSLIGESQNGKRLKIFFKDKMVLDLKTEFMTSPMLYERPSSKVEMHIVQVLPKQPTDYDKILLNMLSDKNVRTKEYAVRQYDHTVRGSTVIGPFSGIVGREGPTDASVIRSDWNREVGVAITHGSNPFYSHIDPYRGAMASVDETVRNLISVGADPLGFSDCLNAGNPEKPEIMGEFISMVQGLHDSAFSLNIPFVSGNVSFYNETGKRRIPTFPTLLGVGKVEDIQKSITPDFKQTGSSIYLVGAPTTDLGGSLYFRQLKKAGGRVPYSDPRILKQRGWNLLKAIGLQTVGAIHDVSDGGMATTISEMTIGSSIGASIDLSPLGLRTDFALFSEPQSSWIVEVKMGKEEKFLEIMRDDAIHIGYTQESSLSVKTGEERVMDISIDRILRKWKKGYQ